jgi:uncharacterized damage-inducible protein DinB
MLPATLTELQGYNQWAHDRIFSAAARCSDADLDRPFEMGPGSLRKTLQHLAGTEKFWLDRWMGLPIGTRDVPEPVSEILQHLADTTRRRQDWLAQTSDETLGGAFQYTQPWDGKHTTIPFLLCLLHVGNHAIHHRAQAVHMLQELGHSVDISYLEGPSTVPSLDAATLQAWMSYGDWAQSYAVDTGRPLGDGVLDTPQHVGAGTLSRILAWYSEGTPGPTSWSELETLYDACSASNHSRPPSRDLVHFCIRGTHHRALALNVYRHAGLKAPFLDMILWQQMGRPNRHAQQVEV